MKEIKLKESQELPDKDAKNSIKEPKLKNEQVFL